MAPIPLASTSRVMPTLTRDDQVLYYAERGDPTGPPVVLLHGLTMSSRTMERLAASLPDYRVLLLDFHGHGKSSKPRVPDRYLVSEFADDVVALLDHLEIEHAVIGGLSLGANVAYEVALRHPDRVRALVLEMPVFARGVPAGRVLFTALAGFFTAVYPVLTPWHLLIRRFPLSSGAYELAFIRDLLAADHLAQAALMRGIARQDPPTKDPDTLTRLTMPILVTAHAYDPVHSKDDAAELVAGLPDAARIDLRSIFDFVLRQEEINRQVGAFLRRLAPVVTPTDSDTAGPGQ